MLSIFFYFILLAQDGANKPMIDYYASLAGKTENLRIFLIADPQIGPADSPVGFERELEQTLQKMVNTANQEQVDLIVFNGDLVAFPRPDYFSAFENAVRPLKIPMALVHGNHDGKYDDGLFLSMQERLCGFRLPNYAFNCGAWRIVVLSTPDLLENNNFDEQIAWLDNELHEVWRSPVMVFLHYHLLPVGLSQLEYYTYPKDRKNKLLDTIVRYGNVQYVFMGHVHNGIKASVRTAWEYQGTKFVVLPTLVPGRAFGEEYPEFNTQKDRGYFVEAVLNGSDMKLVGRQLEVDAKHEYPSHFPIFTKDMDPRSFLHWSEMPSYKEIKNGDFERGLTDWLFPIRYTSEQEPGFIHEIRKCGLLPGEQSLHLFTRFKGHAWQYDESIDAYQVLQIPDSSASPVVKIRYYIPNSEKSFLGGGFIRVALFKDRNFCWMWVGHWGAREERVKHIPKIWAYHDGIPAKPQYLEKYREEGKFITMMLPDYGYRSHHITLNIPELVHSLSPGMTFQSLSPNTMLIMLGVWCGNEEGSFSGAWFDGINVDWNGEGASIIDNLPIKKEVFSPPFLYNRWYTTGYDK
ncbi:MAG: metallophosphoesterase family protein [Candidatus Hydrogenedens sp.]